MRLDACAVVAAILLMEVASPCSAWAAGDRVRGCMSPAQARDVLIAQRFVAPFRAAIVATRTLDGDTVGLQLCLLGDTFVYDVTVLRRSGQVAHVLVDAHSGALLPAPAGGK